jgi:hypothetical protein
MCRNCHKFYDEGDITIVDPGVVIVSPLFNEQEYPDILRPDNTFNISEYAKNPEYYNWHFNRVFKK